MGYIFKITAALALPLAAVLAGPAAAANLLTNGGFETGDFAGWTQAGEPGSSQIFHSPSEFVYNGTYGAALSGNDISTISQMFSTTAGVIYNYSFALANLTDTSSGNFYLSFNDYFYEVLEDVPASDYRLFSGNFTGTGPTTNLALSFSNAEGLFTLDNVLVEAAAAAVPEPATWTMMLLGMGAVGFAMRRRKGKVTTNVSFA